MEAGLEIAFPEADSPLTVTQANQVWAKPYKTCKDLKITDRDSSTNVAGSVVCECADNYIGLLCQHDVRDAKTVLLKRLVAKLPEYVKS